MATIFCPSCGAKAQYQFASPNFCFKCGRSYLESKNSKLMAKMKTSVVDRRKNIDDEPEDDFDDDDFDDDDDFSTATRVPTLRKLDVEIDSTTDVKILKFDELSNSEIPSKFPKGRNLNLNNLIDERQS